MESMTIDKAIEKYARLFVLGDVWADTLDKILKFWSEEQILFSFVNDIMEDTLYLDEIQRNIELNMGMEDWFKEYSSKVNLMSSYVLVKAQEYPDEKYGEFISQETKDNITAFRNTLISLNNEYKSKAEKALKKEGLQCD